MASHVVRVSLAMHLVIGECDMKRFAWWRMEQDTHHLSRALCGAFCSILHHVKRFMSQPPYGRHFVIVLWRAGKFERRRENLNVTQNYSFLGAFDPISWPIRVATDVILI